MHFYRRKTHCSFRKLYSNVYHLARPILALFTIQVKHQYVISLYILYKKVKARFWGTLNTESRVLFSLESHKLEFIRQTADYIL